MEEKKPGGVPSRGISAAVLKYLAYGLMFLNHACYEYFNYVNPSAGGWLRRGHWYLTRGAFVIFAFLISEGLVHTRSRWKYVARLSVFALISEIPYDLAFSGTWFDPTSQNVFFTLAIGAAAICLIEKMPDFLPLKIAVGLCGAALAFGLMTDYDLLGVLLIFVFYFYRDNRPRCFFFASLTLFFGYMAGTFLGWFREITPHLWNAVVPYAFEEAHGIVALLPIALYNGQKGRQLPKWCFYGFYPAHLLLLGLWGILS